MIPNTEHEALVEYLTEEVKFSLEQYARLLREVQRWITCYVNPRISPEQNMIAALRAISEGWVSDRIIDESQSYDAAEIRRMAAYFAPRLRREPK